MSLHLSKVTSNELLYIGFNQDFGCFAVGTEEGFRIYNCEPFKETFRRHFASGGIGQVEMLFRCNILALVGGGKSPKYPPHKVMIWDDHQNRCIGELAFRSDVRAVRLRRDRVVVALAAKVYVYNFADLSLVDHIETVDNPRVGHVRVDLYDKHITTLIPAHDSALACIALNATGTLLATASEKGTLIRVFDTATGEKLQEFRRGTEKAEIYSIAFNADSSMMACTSEKGTVHIFKLSDAVHDRGVTASTTPAATPAVATPASDAATPVDETKAAATGGAPAAVAAAPQAAEARGVGALFTGLLPKYFSSEYSVSQYHVKGRSIVAFGQEPNTIIVVGADGSFNKAVYSVGAAAERLLYSQFVHGGGAAGEI